MADSARASCARKASTFLGRVGKRVISSAGTSQTAPSGSAATRRGDGRAGEQLEHCSLALRREARILDHPFGPRPAAQDEPVRAAAPVDDRERVVCVPSAPTQAPQRGDTTAGANRLGDPAQRPLGRSVPKGAVHLPPSLTNLGGDFEPRVAYS
jgi:hypothetical protein